MKFLLDVCCSSRSLCEFLISLGHDVRLVGADDPCASDEAVLALARQEDRIVVTEDKDFGELIVVLQHPHAGIIRFLDMPVGEQVEGIREVLRDYPADLESRSMVVVTRGRIRIRPR